MTDFHGYNGNEPRELNEVKDLGMEAKITLQPLDRVDFGRAPFGLRSVPIENPNRASQRDRALAKRPVASRSRIALIRLSKKRLWPQNILLEAAVMDGRFQAAIDGRLLFEPFDYDDPVDGRHSEWSPLELGVRGGAAAMRRDSCLS